MSLKEYRVIREAVEVVEQAEKPSLRAQTYAESLHELSRIYKVSLPVFMAGFALLGFAGGAWLASRIPHEGVLGTLGVSFMHFAPLVGTVFGMMAGAAAGEVMSPAMARVHLWVENKLAKS